MDIEKIRKDFPILSKKVNDRQLIYLDNAATTQLPKMVMDCWMSHYRNQNANVHRGIHYLSEQSTIALEEARKIVSEFIGSDDPEQIVFTSGATDSLNLVSQGYAFPRLGPGKKIVVTEFEHHSNFVPWQRIADMAGAEFIVVPLKGDALDLEKFQQVLSEQVVIVSVTAVSNVTGMIMPLKEIISLAHSKGIPVCVDAAQAMRHGEMNVKKLDCEFMAFSGHKMLAPAGTGVLYGKKDYLEQVRPVRFGGGMVDIVDVRNTTFADIPYRLEAGTPNYSGDIALAEAIKYINKIGLKIITQWETELTDYLEKAMRRIKDVKIMGGTQKKCSVVSVAVEGVHPYDLASILDKFGIAARSGNHCAQPLLKKLGYESVIRFSPAFYNTREEIDNLEQAMNQSIAMLRKWS